MLNSNSKPKATLASSKMTRPTSSSSACDVIVIDSTDDEEEEEEVLLEEEDEADYDDAKGKKVATRKLPASTRSSSTSKGKGKAVAATSDEEEEEGEEEQEEDEMEIDELDEEGDSLLVKAGFRSSSKLDGLLKYIKDTKATTPDVKLVVFS